MRGLSPWEAGLWTLPSSVGFVVGSLLAPALVGRARPAFVIAGGLALAAVGFGGLTQIDGTSGLEVLVAATVVMSFGVAAVVTLGTDLIVATAPPERAGAASAISETGAELGGALGIAILGSVGTAVYRGMMAEAVPNGIPSDATEAARGTLGGAVAVGERLPDQLGAELPGAGRAAFAQGFELTAAISAAVLLATAIMAAALLRHVQTGAEPEQQPDMAPDSAHRVGSPRP